LPEEQVSLTLYDPAGNEYESSVFMLSESEHPETYNVIRIRDGSMEETPSGTASASDGVLIVSIWVWLPVGVPPGEWYARASAQSSSAEGPIHLEHLFWPTISIVPDGRIDVFEPPGCHEFSAGDQAVLLGEQLFTSGPEETELIAMYVSEDESSAAGDLAGSIRLLPDESGKLEWGFSLSAFKSESIYHFIVFEDMSIDTIGPYGQGPGPWSCFSVRRAEGSEPSN
jgi:hypothetical protein